MVTHRDMVLKTKYAHNHKKLTGLQVEAMRANAPGAYVILEVEASRSPPGSKVRAAREQGKKKDSAKKRGRTDCSSKKALPKKRVTKAIKNSAREKLVIDDDEAFINDEIEDETGDENDGPPTKKRTKRS